MLSVWTIYRLLAFKLSTICENFRWISQNFRSAGIFDCAKILPHFENWGLYFCRIKKFVLISIFELSIWNFNRLKTTLWCTICTNFRLIALKLKSAGFFIPHKIFHFMGPPTNETKEFPRNKNICADLNLWAINLKFTLETGESQSPGFKSTRESHIC